MAKLSRELQLSNKRMMIKLKYAVKQLGERKMECVSYTEEIKVGDKLFGYILYGSKEKG